MTEEYVVNVWFKSEADVNVEAESQEEAIEEAKRRVQMGVASTTSPTDDEIQSVNVIGTVSEDNRYIEPIDNE